MEGKTLTRKKHPQASANILSALTFSWTIPILWRGLKRDLTEDDLTAPLKEDSSSYLGEKIEELWDKEVKKSRQNGKEPSLVSVLCKAFGRHFFFNGIVLAFLELVLRVVQPLLFGALLHYFSQPKDSPDVSTSKAYLYAAGIIATNFLAVIIGHPNTADSYHLTMKVKIALCSLIYRKALKLNKTALSQTTVGQVVNLLTNDLTHFQTGNLHMLWVGPTQVTILAWLMWYTMGPATAIGLVFLLLSLPLEAWLGSKISKLRLKIAKQSDERIRLMNEIISGIHVIKMYAWEKLFADLINETRRKELKEIKKILQIKGILITFIIMHTRTAMFFTILSYVLFGNMLTAEKVFVVISCYSALKQTMTVCFPQGIIEISEGRTSIQRIKEFLLIGNEQLPFCKILNNNTKLDSESNPLIIPKENDYKHVIGGVGDEAIGIFINNITAKWSQDSKENTLNNVSIDLKRGLTAVIGPVGSGKTSLFHAILQELPLSSGSIKVHGRISYASQEPWLFEGTIRQNILFGKPHDCEKYKRVVRACSLMTDFALFPSGDKTIVGERGATLSGGQRARINLARAIYRDADIYLLDDPLSAVDAHVGKHLFEECIQGYLRNKTVVLITHQLQYLDSARQILLLENGAMTFIGSYQALQYSGLDFSKSLFNEVTSCGAEEIFQSPRHNSFASNKSSLQGSTLSMFDETIKEPTTISEAKSKGSVSCKVYKEYLASSGGFCKAIFILLLFLVTQICASGGDYWLTYWVNLEEHNYNINITANYFIPYKSMITREVCLYTFCSLIAGLVIISLVRSFIFFNACLKSSMNLHNKMFSSIIHATMWFFIKNQSGRILNRFSKDLGCLDATLPISLLDIFQIAFIAIGMLIVVLSVNPFFIIPTIAVAFLCYFVRKFYLSTSQSLNRLEAITRSPVYGHLSTSVQGLTTIKAFKAEDILIREFDNHQDLNSSAFYTTIFINRAFGYWLEIIFQVYIALVTLSFLIFRGDYLSGDVGLSISQAITLTSSLRWGIKQTAELINQMTSVERVVEYSHLECEQPQKFLPGLQKTLEPSWPSKGEIKFLEVYFRYSTNDPYILKGLNFTIYPKEKIGIVGRTGAGKSSLISALFKLSEIEGAIIIDGVDTGTLGLQDLRSKISIIPQEPVLFSGTLRKNLDPFDEYNDDVLWSAVDEVELKETVSEVLGGLQGHISEGGGNLSVGQRQLVCLARAIVRNNRILILDEATANVDPRTDYLIQETIRKKFANCTVLTIAHRLNTVLYSDKILVMNAGKLVEFDDPTTLLGNRNGYFRKMFEQTGPVSEELLANIAFKRQES